MKMVKIEGSHEKLTIEEIKQFEIDTDVKF